MFCSEDLASSILLLVASRKAGWHPPIALVWPAAPRSEVADTRACGRLSPLLIFKRRGLSTFIFLLKLSIEKWDMPMLHVAMSVPLAPAAGPCRDLDVWCLRQRWWRAAAIAQAIAEALGSGLAFPRAPFLSPRRVQCLVLKQTPPPRSTLCQSTWS